jgi:NitT/TauT family transport system substrate-binding protein
MHKQLRFSFLLLITLIITGCAGSTPGVESDRQVRLLLPFRPDVQFAPFYVAQEAGYFAEVGLDVTFEHLAETEAVSLVGAGEADFAIVSGEQVLLARSQGLPVVYVTAWWQDYPVAVAVPTDAGINSIEDLAGKKIGIPGLFGASYIGFRALLASADLAEEDVILDSIGYSQVEAMLAGQEDGVVIYANNEPLQLAAQGQPVTLLRVADYVQLASNGLITNEKSISESPEVVRAMVSAVLRGIEDTIADPENAFDISKKFVDGLGENNAAIQQQVLRESLSFWEAERIGMAEPQAWENMEHILLEMGLLTEALDLEAAFSNEYLPK